ncbi:MAG: tyrosine-type recombinase/integrase, partial [Clostridia bacterium]|nr:tyrosine-type recombinase/integrase [Clostridia bacterium]
RHTFATRCVECGFDAKSLSEILGHANVTTTMAIYVHPTLEQKREQMERLTV